MAIQASSEWKAQWASDVSHDAEYRPRYGGKAFTRWLNSTGWQLMQRAYRVDLAAVFLIYQLTISAEGNPRWVTVADKEFIRACRASRQGVHRALVNRAIEFGWVERRPSPRDGRKWEYAVNPENFGNGPLIPIRKCRKRAKPVEASILDEAPVEVLRLEPEMPTLVAEPAESMETGVTESRNSGLQNQQLKCAYWRECPYLLKKVQEQEEEKKECLSHDLFMGNTTIGSDGAGDQPRNGGISESTNPCPAGGNGGSDRSSIGKEQHPRISDDMEPLRPREDCDGQPPSVKTPRPPPPAPYSAQNTPNLSEVTESAESFGEQYRDQRNRVDVAFERFRAEYPGDVFEGDRVVFRRTIATDADIEVLERTLELHKRSRKFQQRIYPSVHKYLTRGDWKVAPKDVLAATVKTNEVDYEELQRKLDEDKRRKQRRWF